jgi:hypothetical protein
MAEIFCARCGRIRKKDGEEPSFFNELQAKRLHEFSLMLYELRVPRMNCKATPCMIATMHAKRAIYDGKRRQFMRRSRNSRKTPFCNSSKKTAKSRLFHLNTPAQR